MPHLLTPDQRAILGQFLRFGTVGGVGFLVDTAIVYAARGALGLYGAGVVSFLGAATVTWLLNRVWTFRGLGGGPMHRQWLLFLATNAIGFVLNRGAYFTLVATTGICVRYPVLAVAAGAVAGMFANFGLSRRIVFAATAPAPSTPDAPPAAAPLASGTGGRSR